MNPELIVDLALAILLIAVLCAAFVLNRRLVALRSIERQMTDMLESFAEATERAESGVYRLKLAADEAERAISTKIAQAREISARLDAAEMPRAEREPVIGEDEDSGRAALRLVEALRSAR
jgi:hypothetical protein